MLTCMHTHSSHTMYNTGCVSIITTVMPSATATTVGGDVGGNAATLSALSLTTLLVALTVSVAF